MTPAKRTGTVASMTAATDLLSHVRSCSIASFAICASSCILNAADYDNRLFPSSPPAADTCEVDISQWFRTLPIRADAPVLPADSLHFSDDTNNDFYRWSWQMFLWLTTPTGKDGGLVLNSAPFFDFDLSNGALTSDASLITGINKTGSVDEATGNAFIWGEDNLVYYGIHTNDVYAFFQKLNEEGEISPKATHFPTTITDLAPIISGALINDRTLIRDGQTLAMELKTSWVDASTVPNKADYITIRSAVPVYSKTSSQWTPQEEPQVVELALVGVHVVGSAKGHPEMIWATFEHADNAPNDAYSYLGPDGETVYSYSNFDSTGKTTSDWLFINSGINKNDIPMQDSFAGSLEIEAFNSINSDGSIVATNGATIKPQKVYRLSPWGSNTEQPTSPAESNAKNNTDIISLNQSVLEQLADGDIRANYFLVGALWTNGQIPVDPNSTIPNGSTNVINKGSLTLSNTTMETYIQQRSCFQCHKGSPLGIITDSSGKQLSDGLSHIYSDIKTVNP